MFLTLGMQKRYSAWYIASLTPVLHSLTSVLHPVLHPVLQNPELSVWLKASSKKPPGRGQQMKLSLELLFSKYKLVF